jgi:hypothetical protein
MPLNRSVPCERCGKAFSQGFATINHMKVCVRERNVGITEDVEVQNDGVVHHGVEDDGLQEDNSLEEYLANLERNGTLDPTHMVQYLSWKRVPLTDEVLEVCKFLRSVESGSGCSDGAARHSLLYAKSLGGRADLLPKTMETCWSKVAKVLLNVHFDVH